MFQNATSIYRGARALGIAALVATACVPPAMASGEEPEAPPAAITVVGFDAPESVVHDPRTDTYLVSNIGGALPRAATAEDGNGFISTIAPDGTVLDRAWIGLGRDGVTLNAPKGLALSGGSLYVADIDVVHRFDRRTGSLIQTIGVPGAVFLNDVARAPGGGVFVSDTAFVLNADGTALVPGEGDAIYRIGRDGDLSTVAEGPELDSPNGLTVDRRGRLLGVSVDTSNEVYTIDGAGDRQSVRATPVGQLDGLEVLADGSYVVSSFGESAVVRVPRNG
ncbi:MAG: SMP-30/gluconolactonase/LRE family protein, partial [Nocardioides sp.]